MNTNVTRPSSRAMLRLALIPLFVAACMSTAAHKRDMAALQKARDDDAAAAKAQQQSLTDQLAAAHKDFLDLQAKLADVEAKLADTQTQLAAANADKAALHKKLDDSTALVATLEQRLEKLGQNVDSLIKQRGQLTQAMADAQARLDDLKKQAAAAEARAATFRNLVAKLHAMIDSGQLKVIIRNGRMIIALPNDILFDSGATDVKAAGKAALAQVAHALATVSDRDFLVAGHTDNVPIHTAAFPSNWELSTRRAVEVVHYLISQGMSPKVLAAAGYGEFDPVVPNDTPDHRAQNRRIEIVLQPNLSDLPPLDDLEKK